MTAGRFVHDLVAMTAADYEGAVARYVGVCADLPGVRAIYQFGSVGAPGVSDLDLIVVLDDEVTEGSADLARLSIAHPSWRGDETLARCFIHDVLVCSVEVFRFIDWFIVGGEMTLVAGRPVERCRPDDANRVMIALVQGLDFCIGRLHEFARLGARPRVSMRWLIPQLWSATHTLGILRQVGAEVGAGWDGLDRDLRELRSRPVGAIDDATLDALWDATWRHFALAVESLAVELARRGGLPNDPVQRGCTVADRGQRAIVAYHADRRSGARTGGRSTAVTRAIQVGGRRLETIWTRVDLPGAVLHHHLAYLRASPAHGGVARRIARRAGVSVSEASEATYRSVVERRMWLVEANERVLGARQLGFGRLALPGLPRGVALGTPRGGTWRRRVLGSFLDWRAVPARAVTIAAASRRSR